MNERDVWKLVKPLRPLLKSGTIDEPHSLLLEKMRETSPNPFKLVIDLEFTNDPGLVAEVFDNFVDTAAPGKMRMIYTEINGFQANPDCWYFDPFGFPDLNAIDSEDFGAFDFHSERHSTVLEGMEDLQELYATQREHRYERWLAAYIVISKFHQLIRKSVMRMRWRELPVFADGHDHGFVARVN